MHREVGAGSAVHHAAAGSVGREQACGIGQLLSGDVGTFGDVLGSEAADRLGELVEPLDILCQELCVAKLFTNDQVDHRGQYRRVLARARLDVDRGTRSRLGAARIDHDELHAAADGLLQALCRILARNPDRFGDDRIGSDQQPTVGFVEVDVATEPVSVRSQCDLLAGLVDGVGGEEHRRFDPAQERVGHQRARRVGKAVGAQVHRHRARPVPVDQFSQTGRDLVRRAFALDGGVGPVGLPLLAGQQARRVVVDLRQRPALCARVALEHRVVRITGDLGQLAVGDGGKHTAVSGADAADSR